MNVQSTIEKFTFEEFKNFHRELIDNPKRLYCYSKSHPQHLKLYKSYMNLPDYNSFVDKLQNLCFTCRGVYVLYSESDKIRKFIELPLEYESTNCTHTFSEPFYKIQTKNLGREICVKVILNEDIDKYKYLVYEKNNIPIPKSNYKPT